MSDLMLDCFGRPVFPFDLKPGDIKIEEVAESLSKICRFYCCYKGPSHSVAEHSLNVEAFLERESNKPLVQLVGLLHDAHEMLLGYIPSPWYPHLIMRLEARGFSPLSPFSPLPAPPSEHGQVPLRKYSEVLQYRVTRLLLPPCAAATYTELHPQIMQIVDDADHQILLWEKIHILHSDLPWPNSDAPHSIPDGWLPHPAVGQHYLLIIQAFKDTYARLFSAVESSYGSPSAEAGPRSSETRPEPSPDHANGFCGS